MLQHPRLSLLKSAQRTWYAFSTMLRLFSKRIRTEASASYALYVTTHTVHILLNKYSDVCYVMLDPWLGLLLRCWDRTPLLPDCRSALVSVLMTLLSINIWACSVCGLTTTMVPNVMNDMAAIWEATEYERGGGCTMSQTFFFSTPPSPYSPWFAFCYLSAIIDQTFHKILMLSIIRNLDILRSVTEFDCRYAFYLHLSPEVQGLRLLPPFSLQRSCWRVIFYDTSWHWARKNMWF
jgi:hypothetical protein